MTLPVAIMSGRMYSVAPEPNGGTQAAFARTTFSTASTKRSSGNGGITMRRALLAMRFAFCSGLKQTMSPFSVVYALRPSNTSWQ